MKNLLRALELKSKLKNKNLMLFLDYDGTLSPIVQTPDRAVLPKRTKTLLETLSKKQKCKLVIISGRSLKDVKKRVGVGGITYVGNHGFQIEGPGIKLNKAVPQKYKRSLKKIKSDLIKRTSLIKDVFIEDKGLSFSLHYRMVDKKKVSLVRKIFRQVVCNYLTRNDIEVKNGKKLLEVRPTINWDKGKAVLWLLSKRQFISKNDKMLPIYVGDDVTDEDAFRVLKNKGISVFVGRPNKKSNAKYYLKSPKEVTYFLVRLKEILGMT